jgi:putative protein-disulfide isomerase
MTATLFYIHDPMCSWCWGFSAVWQSILKQLPKGVQLETVLGGLAPDSDAPMPEDTQQFLKKTWKHIESVIPGTPFNYDFWSLCKPRRSTYPSCRAVIAARAIDPKRELEMISAIQTAYYLQAKNPSDAAVLIELAEAVGLDKTQFAKALNSADVEQSLEENIHTFRNFGATLGVSGFPSLVLKTHNGCAAIPIDYNNSAVTLDAIHAHLAS